jgi:SARP family transcriptional regulator, regulator of embCAB operon
MRIYVAGSLTVEDCGAVLHERSLPGGQGRVLLGMLAVEHDRPLSREEIADELWAEGLPRSWETALPAVVSKLRAALSAAGIPADGLIANAFGCYQLHLPRGGWLDIDAARDSLHAATSALRRGDARAAVPDARVTALICRQPFLPGQYGPWTCEQRQRLEDMHIRAEECRAEAYATLGEHTLSAEAAEAALALDPYREKLYQRLIQARLLAGDRAAAARAYRRCHELFARDLRVEPSASTLALMRQAAPTA